MKLYTTLHADELQKIERTMGIDLYQFDFEGERIRGKYRGKLVYNFLLRPKAGHERWRAGRYNPWRKVPGIKRIWAISWAGHYVFMRAVMLLDPDAVFKTAITTWAGADDFDNRAFDTRHINTGSIAFPWPAEDAEAPDHIEWADENDLRTLAREVAYSDLAVA